jgi:hypothetical protein
LAAGQRGLSAWDVIPSGQTVTGEIMYDTHESSDTSSDNLIVNLPGVAPVPLDATTVNFDALSGASDADATCVGTVAAPTAPAGQVCIYLASSNAIDLATLQGQVGSLPTRAFSVEWSPSGLDNADEYVFATCAYTAP